MNKKLTFVAMLAIALSLGACNSKPGSSSSDSGTDNPTTSVTAPTTSSTPTTTAPTPTTSVTPDTSSVTPSTSTPAPSTSTPTPVEEHKVVLPEIDGLSIRASKLTPEEGEEVTLYLSTGSSKRLDAVTLNGSPLEIKESNQKGTKICKFAMPADADAVIDATVVNVYAITIDDAVKDSFGIVCDVTSAAKDETVTFKPASYAGYWYKAVVALQDDVALQPNEDGSYSFTMPGHSVTLSATTGENVYAVTWDTADCSVSAYRYVPSSSDPEKMLMSYLKQGEAVPVGEEIHFTVKDSGYYKVVDKVFFNDNELTKNDAGEYVVSMPAYPVNLDVTTKDHIRYLSCEGSEHFDVKLTKKVTEGEATKEVEATTALYDDIIYINVTDKTPDVAHKFVVSEYNLFYGNTEDKITNNSTSYKVTTDDDGRYYFKVGNYEYTKLTLTELESELKGTALPGSYVAYHPYYSSSQAFTIYETGTTTSIGSYAYKNPQKINDGLYNFTQNTTYNPKTISFYVNEASTTDGKKYANLLINVSTTTLGFSKGDTYVTSNNKDFGAFVLSNSYAYAFTESISGSTKVTKQFYHAAYENGAVDVYYDDYTKTAYWDVTPVLVSGTDGKTAGDIIAIKDGDTVLANFRITSIKSSGDGYQHLVEEVAADSVAGTYTNGDFTLTLNGFGEATLNDAAGTYVVDSDVANKVVVTIDGVEAAYLLDLENHTYASATLPTDGYEGTYIGDDGDLVLDGYDKATLNGAEGTYTLDGDVVTITIGEATHTYSLDKTNGTYSGLSQFAGLQFAGSFTDKLWGDTNRLYLDFDNYAGIKGQIRVNNAKYYFDFTGTFDASTNKLSLTITKAVNAEFVDKVLEATVTFADNGSVASITFNTNLNDNVYNISGTTVTPVAA